jgi:GNAT superfamily N-acetyltransferase
MGNGEKELQPILSHTEPVLTVQDISETILYWQNTLGFPDKWTWGEPPSHGGVSWHGAFVQFSRNPQLSIVSKGNSIWIRVQRVGLLYDIHQHKNAEIVAPLKNQPYGMAEYTIKEINGYFIHFAGPVEERKKSIATLPETVRIIAQIPTAEEWKRLASDVGWPLPVNNEMIEMILAAAVFAVVAEDTISGDVIGSALLAGDHASFYYVKDVIVHPSWQGKRVGTAMMQKLNDWLDENGANKALVGLIARETLEPFYLQFGFAKAFSMVRYIKQDENNK